MIHELKILPKYFAEVIKGTKTFEIRKNDRNFKIDDILALNEWDGENYTGKSCLVYVDYILEDNMYLKDNFVVMSIKPCTVLRNLEPYNPLTECTDYSVPYDTRMTANSSDSQICE